MLVRRPLEPVPPGKTPRPPNYLKAQAVILTRAQARREVVRPVVLRLREQGMTLEIIAESLQEQGYKTARGGRWHKSTVLRLLRPATFKERE